MNITLDKNDEIVMKLLHYFITEHGYNPIILQGAKDEIWLENSDGSYKIIRIVTNYIHNDEQFEWDIYKTKRIVSTIKRKTFSFNMNVLSIFINLGDNVHLKDSYGKNMDCILLNELKDIEKYENVKECFPSIEKVEEVNEKGIELFIKLTEEINKKNKEDAEKVDEVFSKKKPIITYALIISNIIMFIMTLLAGGTLFDIDINTLYDFGGLVNYNNMSSPAELYRVITSMFLHSGIIHLGFNMYSLYVLGPQLESFFGKFKFFMIYMLSGIIGGLVSMIFQADNIVSIGASGAIFGLLGAFIFFGYYYRVYLGQVIKSQIIPLLILNLALGFMVAGINMFAHLGGLIGGVLAAKAVGIKYKTDTSDNINGCIMLTIFSVFLLYMIGVFK
jgi:rhomboid protease GluP